MQWVSCLKMSYPSWWPWQFGDRWLKFSFLFPQLYQDFCTQGTLCSFLCLEIHSTWAVKQIQVVFCQNPWQRWYRILFLSFLSNQDYDLDNFERPNCPKWRDHVSFEQSSQSENPRNAVAGCLQNPWFIVFFESFGNHIINGPTCTPSSRGI